MSTISWRSVPWRWATGAGSFSRRHRSHPLRRGRPLPPALEEEVAAELCRLIPWVERVRFLKTGAEALAAAVRLARLATGRDAVLGCGYHGWLDWCQVGEGRGVPAATRALYGELPYNDAQRTRALVRARGSQLAAVVFEPFILAPPDPEWLGVLREETERAGALLVVDEVKTVCRLAIGGGCERYGSGRPGGDGQGDRQRLSLAAVGAGAG
jgi:glutamate-1-semialdehyde 2,1-aminomutase